MSRARELALRRERLLVRSAQLRTRLAQDAQILAVPLTYADRAVGAVLWLRRNPQWPLGVLAVWIVWRPRRALHWASRLWWLWGVGQRLQRLLSALAPPLRP